LSGHRHFGLRNLAMGAQVAGSLLLLKTDDFFSILLCSGMSAMFAE
jgi:hypothetical protein